MKHFIDYLLIVPLLALASCNMEYAASPAPESEEKSVMLKVAVPYTAPHTRSVGAAQENTIETLDILAFKAGGGAETFLYRTEAIKDTGNTEGAPSQAFSAALHIEDFPQRFVVIANARSRVAELVSRVEWRGAEKEAMLSQLTFDLGGSDRWNTTSAANYTAIPMWGECGPKIIDAATTSLSNDLIPMLRMVAKIEVQLDTDNRPALVSAFKLRSVHVYNTNTSGRIVPELRYMGPDMTVTKASLPASVAMAAGPLAYTDFTSPGIADIAMRGAIYLFETAAKNAGDFLDETCIVVGGLYRDDTVQSYYRLDFFAPDGATHLDLLRNHRYACNIVDVRERGYPTADDAYRARSVGLTADVIAWNEGGLGDVVFDRQYMLRVSHDRFEFSGAAHGATDADNILEITTDHPTGWTASVWADKAGTTSAPWLSLDAASGAGDAQPCKVCLLADVNNSGSRRMAYIHIGAGRSTYIVTVIQAA